MMRYSSSVRPRRFGLGALATATMAAMVACVGSDDSPRAEQRATPPPSVVSNQPTRWDSVQPLPYQMFERVYVEKDSSRLLTRLLVLGQPEREALSKTVMAALDSLGRADSSLVAARAILYTALMTEPGRATLVPRLWAEWVPPGGWGSTEARGPRTVHRTFVYDVDPGWGSQPAAEVEDE